MSDNNSTLVPADNGEATPPAKKPSLRARIKARRQKFETEHPLRSACCEEALKGATYAAAAFGTLIALGALMSLGSNTDDETDDTIESDAEDILDDEEE